MITINIILDKGKLKFYKRWLEYIPEFWNLNQILNKTADTLTKKDLEILTQVQKDKKEVEIINIFLNKINKLSPNKEIVELNCLPDDYQKINDVIQNFNITSIAKNKLPETEILELENIINKYDGYNKITLESEINNLNNKFTKEYAFFMLDNYVGNFLYKKSSINNIKTKNHQHYLNQRRRKKY